MLTAPVLWKENRENIISDQTAASPGDVLVKDSVRLMHIKHNSIELQSRILHGTADIKGGSGGEEHDTKHSHVSSNKLLLF